jgi:hypothetical protein
MSFTKLKSLFFLFAFTLFLLCDKCKSADLESQLIPGDQNSRGQYSNLPNHSDASDSDDEVVNEDEGSWKIPKVQLDVGVPIYGTIFGFMTAWGLDDPIDLFIRATYVMAFLVSVQIYFGFYFTCMRSASPSDSCAFIPRLGISKIDFGNGPKVSFGRWASGPFSWISAIFGFLPPQQYAYLQEKAFFPGQPMIHLLLMVQLLYYFGLYDCYRGTIMPPPAANAEVV